MPQIVTRGLLVDVSERELGARRRESSASRTLDGIEPEPGDAVLFHTGWGAHWEDPDAYLAGEPGPGCEVAEWLAAHGVALTGCDTWSYGPVPAEDPERPFEVPQHPERPPRRLRRREPRHERARRRRRARVRARPHPSEAARRHRRLDLPIALV